MDFTKPVWEEPFLPSPQGPKTLPKKLWQIQVPGSHGTWLWAILSLGENQWQTGHQMLLRDCREVKCHKTLGMWYTASPRCGHSGITVLATQSCALNIQLYFEMINEKGLDRCWGLRSLLLPLETKVSILSALKLQSLWGYAASLWNFTDTVLRQPSLPVQNFNAKPDLLGTFPQAS